MEPRDLLVFIGTAGWSIPRSCAEFFPGAGSHLERYARVLPCAEINSTFYRSPRPATYARWSASIPESFRFSVKAPRAFTHEAGLACTAAQIRAFLDEAQNLGRALGPILFQLPPKLAFDEDRAESFFSTLRELYPGPAVVEPRHPSWFEPAVDLLLNKLQIARAAADPSVTPAAALPGGYPGVVYFRLHGSPRKYYSSYTPEFVEEIADRIKHSADSAAVWCIFDNTASGAAAENALSLSEILR